MEKTYKVGIYGTVIVRQEKEGDEPELIQIDPKICYDYKTKEPIECKLKEGQKDILKERFLRETGQY